MNYVAQTFVNPLGLAFTLLMGLFLVILPRRYAIVPILMLICFMTMGTNIVIAGFNFTMLRLLLVFGWARLIIRKEIRPLKLNGIDIAVIAFTISSIVTYTLLWGTYDAFKYKLGMAYNAAGFFFFFRYLLRDAKDCIRIARVAAILVVPLAGIILIEKTTGHNLFAPLGGVPAVSAIREGVIRCQGPFAHPILAGSFGATLLPLFLGLWKQKGNSSKFVPYIAILSAAAIVFCSGSSGPVLAGLAGIMGFFAWSIRQKLRMIRWGLVIVFLSLVVTMKAPVWYLMARVDIFSGNTGWHRAHLIDAAVKNLSDWWLIGTKSNEHWDDYDHNYDVTNQYIVYGIDGGLVTMGLFILTIVRCYSAVGLIVKRLHDQPGARIFAWSLGAALFAHTVNYFSISYFDQNIIAWYMLLAMIAALSDYALRLKRPTAAIAVSQKQEVPIPSYA